MTLLDVTLRIFRYKPGERPHYDTFTVQVADTAHIIDAIDAIWATLDRSLTFRRACHHSSCGSCALRVNGVEKLPCITRLVDVWDGHTPLRLDPLRNFPIVSDLVVDVSGFFQRMSASEMTITRDAEPTLPLSVDKVAGATVFIRHAWAVIVSAVAGLIMIAWEVVEIAMVQQFSWFEALFIAIGLWIIGLASYLWATEYRGHRFQGGHISHA